MVPPFTFPPDGHGETTLGALGGVFSIWLAMGWTFGAPPQPLQSASAAAWVARPYMTKPAQLSAMKPMPEPSSTPLVPRVAATGELAAAAVGSVAES
jgi:hypothetical protein